MEVKDYYPIGLLSSVYKIVSKVLTSRLKFVMKDNISKLQGTFMIDRQILDGILNATNESVDEHGKAPRMVVLLSWIWGKRMIT